MTKYRDGLDGVLHALADPTRRTMLDRMTDGPVSVTDLAAPFGIALPTAMTHVRVLVDAGLVETTKSGRVRACALRPGALDEASAWITRRQRMWAHRLRSLDRTLEQGETT
ncbi:helix-turn-helix transcriptional regulator [Microbacterium sp. cx-59]|uniref:ArsR/SmtB family transcription factor n=1 Tax=Microbacterium sp. cx-59 TaxID=2891207 RepID=UPI001E4B0B6E|nr:metalloregulator ArsR/SmtB family transcription factor [Microbacterium sp. cx-59]MCC4909549.1 metalloregulator ArsR/SmtB family transcription factor [Microbacterium sp. cx-59]